MEKDMEQVMKKAEVLIEALPYIPVSYTHLTLPTKLEV